MLSVIKKYAVIITIGFYSLFGGVMFGLATPQTASAAACSDSVLGFRPWYYGISKTDGDECKIISPTELKGGITEFIWKIAINIIDIGLVFVIYVAFFFILYGGFLFLVSQGRAEDIVKARKSVLYAVIGIVISVAAEGIVRFISSKV